MAGVGEVSDQTFESEILQGDKPAIVDFWAEWCAPCRQISPIVTALASTYGDQVRIVKMNIDESPSTPAKFGVRSIPTILAFKGGQVVDQMVGMTPRAKEQLEEMVKKLL